MATRTILLDIGGTFIKCSDGREIPIDSAGTREEIVSSLRQAVAGYDSASIAIPGPFRYDDGTFLMKHKFAAVYGEKFQELCGLEDCNFVHDVNVMLLGELAGAKAEGHDRVALAALGTGLGFATAIDGKILTNELGSPLVHIYNRPYGDGILEDYVSKRGFLRGYEGITVKDLAERAKEGDAAALARFDECGRILGRTLAPIIAKMGISRLLFGGQISRSYFLFGPALEEELAAAGVWHADRTETEAQNAGTLTAVGPVSDVGSSTFNGLKELARREAAGESCSASKETADAVLGLFA